MSSSRWKTSKPRSRNRKEPSFREDDESTDGLSFLDDMLGSAAVGGGLGSSASKRSSNGSSRHSGGMMPVGVHVADNNSGKKNAMSSSSFSRSSKQQNQVSLAAAAVDMERNREQNASTGSNNKRKSSRKSRDIDDILELVKTAGSTSSASSSKNSDPTTRKVSITNPSDGISQSNPNTSNNNNGMISVVDDDVAMKTEKRSASIGNSVGAPSGVGTSSKAPFFSNPNSRRSSSSNLGEQHHRTNSLASNGSSGALNRPTSRRSSRVDMRTSPKQKSSRARTLSPIPPPSQRNNNNNNISKEPTGNDRSTTAFVLDQELTRLDSASIPKAQQGMDHVGSSSRRNSRNNSPQAPPHEPNRDLPLHPATFEQHTNSAAGDQQQPFYGTIVNATRNEDDISQITSSVTSQSYYDSRTGDHSTSRQSTGSRGGRHGMRSSGISGNQPYQGVNHDSSIFPWSGRRNKNNVTSGAGFGRSRSSDEMSQIRDNNDYDPTHRIFGGADEHSYADTLDQIANMIHPSGATQQHLQSSSVGSTESGGSKSRATFSTIASRDPLMLASGAGNLVNTHTSNRGTLPTRSLDSNFFTNKGKNNGNNTQAQHHHHQDTAAQPLYPYPPNNQSTPTSPSALRKLRNANGAARAGRDSWFEPTVSQLRLQIRTIYSFLIPREWRIRSKKQDAKEEDYFGNLMRSNPHPDGPKGSRSKNRLRRRQRFMECIMNLGAIFCCLTVLILVLRLIFMHVASSGTRGVENRWSKNNGKAGKFHKQKKGHHGGGGLQQLQFQQQQQPASQAQQPRVDIDSRAGIRGGMTKRKVDNGVPNIDNGLGGDGVIQMGGSLAMNQYEHTGHINMPLPMEFDALSDVADLPVQQGSDIPYFWHIPRTGGGTVSAIFGGCLSMTLASDGGTEIAEGAEYVLQVQKNKADGQRYVNVDTSTPAGIQRAASLNLAASGMADMVVSTLLYQATSLFHPIENRGRMFAMLRHPVDRAVSLFHYVQATQWRKRQSFQKELSDLTIDEYFKSGLAENNWMVRFLTNQLTKGELTREDVHLAKEILRRKCLVGLLKEKGESFARFEKYFGLTMKDDREKECHEKKLQWAWPLKHRHDPVEEGTKLWDLVLDQNKWDMELYDYAVTVLFPEQAELFE